MSMKVEAEAASAIRDGMRSHDLLAVSSGRGGTGPGKTTTKKEPKIMSKQEIQEASNKKEFRKAKATIMKTRLEVSKNNTKLARSKHSLAKPMTKTLEKHIAKLNHCMDVMEKFEISTTPYRGKKYVDLMGTVNSLVESATKDAETASHI